MGMGERMGMGRGGAQGYNMGMGGETGWGRAIEGGALGERMVHGDSGPWGGVGMGR